MRKSIIPLLAVLLAPASGLARDSDLERERRLIRQQLERIGIKVDHFADTPAEREREAREIRRQLERMTEPKPGVRNGGASPNRKSIRQSTPPSGLGAKRKL